MTTPVDVVVAVHHPLRRRLMELLSLDGPATASRLAATTDQLVGNVSHHLKVLGAAGLIEEAPDLARDRRERWWRVVPHELSWSLADAMGDPAAETVLAAAEQQNLAHQVAKVQAWAARRHGVDPAWTEAAFSTESWLEVTPDELVEVQRRIMEVLKPYSVDAATHRRVDPPHDDVPRERVFVFAHGVPSQP